MSLQPSNQLIKTQHRQSEIKTQQVNQPEDDLLLDHTRCLIFEHCVHLELRSPFLSGSGLGGIVNAGLYRDNAQFVTLTFPMLLDQLTMGRGLNNAWLCTVLPSRY